jgi:hypothetical protein
MTTRLQRFAARAALALIVGLSSAHSARAQSAARDGANVTSPSDSDATIRREIELARARGVPVEPLLSKVREGRLKRAPVPRIRSAVAALAVRLDTVRSIIGPDATLEELTAGADALAAGATPAELRLVSSASSTRPVSAPIGALAQLVASGVSPKRAARMILELLRRKVGGAVVLAFGNLVESDAASGMPAEEAAAFRLHSLATGGSAALLPGSPTNAGAASVLMGPRPTSSPPRRRP